MNENDGVVEQRNASHHYSNIPSLLYSCSTVAIAIAAMPSPRPIAPSCSFVVALMLMRDSVAPIACAIFFRIAGIWGAILGASEITVASTFTARAFSLASSSLTRCKILMLLMPRIDSSVFGKCWPMSPAPIAPRSASAIAWERTSPSECPSSPCECGISTPPRINCRSSAKRCTS